MSDCRALVVVPRRVETAYDRFVALRDDPMAMEMIGQRVMDGETLKQIARGQGVPVMQFIGWLMADPDRKAAYEAALKVRADELALETVSIADTVTRLNPDGSVEIADVPRDSLRVKTRMNLATFLDRERFGERKAPTATARVIVDRACGDGQDTVAVEVTSQ